MFLGRTGTVSNSLSWKQLASKPLLSQATRALNFGNR